MPLGVQGDVPHGETFLDAEPPVTIGGKATTAAPTAVTSGQKVRGSFDLQGRLRVIQDAAPVPVSAETGTVYNGTVTTTPVFVAITASVSGNNTLLVANATKKIRVVALNLVASAAVNAKVQSGASGTDLTGLWYFAANGGIVLPFNQVGWFETATNTLLNLNLSGAVAVGGSFVYIPV